ncbi:MAG: hypothetical protein QM740_21265 [Acidovorax sp.]
MDALPRSLLHGSRRNAIDRLNPLLGNDHAPFGPALYLTEDPQVANCYVCRTGAIYTVELVGNSQLTIAMNACWKALSVDARLVITRLFKAASMPVPSGLKHAREILDSVEPAMDKRQRNAFLAAEGIWMLFGHIGTMEDSGLCDRGVQYALLCTSAIASQRLWEIP